MHILNVCIDRNIRVMKYNNFEKHISESFLHDSAAVDTDALIASLGIPVAMEPKRRVAWWMLTGLALLSLLMVGLYYFMDVPMSAHVSDASSIVTSDGMIGNSNAVSPILAEQDESNNEKIINQELNSTEVLANLEETKIQTTVSTGNENSAKIKMSKTTYGLIDKNESRNELKTVVQHSATSQYLTTTTVVSSIDVSAMLNKEKENSQEVNITKVDNQSRMLDPLLPIDILESTVVSEDDSPGLTEPECPSFSYRIPWNIALLAEVGVMKPMKDLENVGSASSAFDLRDTNESSKEAIQIGLHAKISKGKNPLYVRGGAAYTRIAEQMNEEYDYIELDTTRGLISITTSMTGDTVTAIYGDVVSETRFTGRSEKHYFLHLLDIPVAVGYELPLGGSFYAGAEVGAQFNIRTSGSGLIFRDVNDYADLSEVTTKETKVGISYFGGFHVGKHLSKRSSIQLSARFRYYPSRFSTVTPNIEQRYNLAGLHAGYVFRF